MTGNEAMLIQGIATGVYGVLCYVWGIIEGTRTRARAEAEDEG